MSRTKLEIWEQGLEDMFDQIDNQLEDKYRGQFALHPSRPKRGATSSQSQDGLIEIKCNFSLGLGSELGEGYIVQPRFATLEVIFISEKNEIRDFILNEISIRLQIFFPNNTLDVHIDGGIMKIHGDLKF